jgi:hypothetical protein
MHHKRYIVRSLQQVLSFYKRPLRVKHDDPDDVHKRLGDRKNYRDSLSVHNLSRFWLNTLS